MKNFIFYILYVIIMFLYNNLLNNEKIYINMILVYENMNVLIII